MDELLLVVVLRIELGVRATENATAGSSEAYHRQLGAVGQHVQALLAYIVSVGGLTNFPFYPTYSASKAAAHSLTQAQRMLLKAEGIRVHGVYPGPLDTDMSKAIEMEKASPAHVASAILDAVERGDEDIFPDAWAADFGQQFTSAPKESERQIASMLG